MEDYTGGMGYQGTDVYMCLEETKHVIRYRYVCTRQVKRNYTTDRTCTIGSIKLLIVSRNV